MKRSAKILLPVIVIAFSIMSAVIIIKTRPAVETEPVKENSIQVHVQEVFKETVKITVKTQGSVVPRTETSLVSRVSGQVSRVSPAFVNGGFFEEGDILLTIDRRDYELALKQAELQVAQAELRLRIEEQEGRVARLEWQRLNEGQAPALVAREPQLNEAQVSLEAAKASVEQAKLNLERTEIKAPYDGRVRSKQVDIGQFINPGMGVAQIYAVDFAEVRLPIPNDELAYLDIPVEFLKTQMQRKGPNVVLKSKFAGRDHEWNCFISRVEGEVDARSRMIHVVARYEDPYGRNGSGSSTPLTVGMFVDAEIEGKEINNIFVIPRSLLRENSRVLIVDKDNRIRFRDVKVFRTEPDLVYINDGLEDGERVCSSILMAVVEGMSVTVINDQDQSSGEEK